jgi:hypothetical protein
MNRALHNRENNTLHCLKERESITLAESISLLNRENNFFRYKKPNNIKKLLAENIKFRQVGTATNKRTCGCLCRALQILLRCRRLRWLPKETGGSAAEEAETIVPMDIRRLPEEETKPTN